MSKKSGSRTSPRPAAHRTRSEASYRYHVYVIELARGVLYERAFQKANPFYDPERPCVYVGMTGLDPETRFARHKAGVKANRYAQKYGVRLLPQLYAAYNPMPYEGAREMEVELAVALREQGWGVWQG
jgi:predicted GIY-YIG superfamily endonuclease